jgi:hypothetical protein
MSGYVIIQRQRIYEAVQEIVSSEPGSTSGATVAQVAANTGLDLATVALIFQRLAVRAVLQVVWNTDLAQIRAMPFPRPPGGV